MVLLLEVVFGLLAVDLLAADLVVDLAVLFALVFVADFLVSVSSVPAFDLEDFALEASSSDLSDDDSVFDAFTSSLLGSSVSSIAASATTSFTSSTASAALTLASTGSAALRLLVLGLFALAAGFGLEEPLVEDSTFMVRLLRLTP